MFLIVLLKWARGNPVWAFVGVTARRGAVTVSFSGMLFRV